MKRFKQWLKTCREYPRRWVQRRQDEMIEKLNAKLAEKLNTSIRNALKTQLGLDDQAVDALMTPRRIGNE